MIIMFLYIFIKLWMEFFYQKYSHNKIIIVRPISAVRTSWEGGIISGYNISKPFLPRVIALDNMIPPSQVYS